MTHRDKLPASRAVLGVDAVKNYDDRDALVCALTALAVAAGDFTAVGDELKSVDTVDVGA
jgi:hypothetical protein